MDVRPLDNVGRESFLGPVHPIVSEKAWLEAAALFAKGPALRWRRGDFLVHRTCRSASTLYSVRNYLGPPTRHFLELSQSRLYPDTPTILPPQHIRLQIRLLHPGDPCAKIPQPLPKRFRADDEQIGNLRENLETWVE